jgi:hypothetical protein
MYRFRDKSQEISWRRYPVGKSRDRNTIALNLLPVTDITYPPAALELLEEYLREEIEIADKSRLEYD